MAARPCGVVGGLLARWLLPGVRAERRRVVGGSALKARREGVEIGIWRGVVVCLGGGAEGVVVSAMLTVGGEIGEDGNGTWLDRS